VSILIDTATLQERRAIARGPFSALTQGLRAELEPVLAGAVEIPREKALLSRTGGRCPNDGSLLRFDPLDPRHLCPTCGVEVEGELHDRFRPYWYQLWLAERVLHAAVLGVLLEDATCIDAAWRILDAYADRYLEYPNRDNVLGPSRPFFSTYLESIWLLQLVLAVDLLESGQRRTEARGERVRDRIIEPSARLIQSYDEGVSNRQVWNDAAMHAAGALLADRRLIDHALDGPSGLDALLSSALLADGSWYEGENYHLFAHRGLWYAVTMAERFGRSPADALVRRFDAGFAAPFRTLLPDLTYPSRRDSQYAVSVRQPRFAESCELGLARTDDARLLGMLARLYDPRVPVRDTGRRASTADVERNLPAARLTRADLSWRALLFARATLPPLEPQPLASDLLPAQGFGIIRREAGHCFVGLDYGRSGGGHGHPDRLNLLLSDGDVRWFDDPGTGSYVDESLHWYRSTLAHTAPLVDGHSQPRVDGELLAFDDRGSVGWMCANAELAPGLVVRRSIVVLNDYLVDRIEWDGDEEHEVALPLHGVRVVGDDGAPISGAPAAIPGGNEREDGFSFLTDAARLAPNDIPVRLRSDGTSHTDVAHLDGWFFVDAEATWWRAVAPGPPGGTPQSLVLARASARRGGITAVWSWRGGVRSAGIDRDTVTVHRADGTTHAHRSTSTGWRIDGALDSSDAIELGLGVPAEYLTGASAHAAPRRDTAEPTAALAIPYRRKLGERDYRRSEQSWKEAGSPTCVVSLERDGARLVVRVAMPRAERRFVAIDAENPFDNDPAAIHGDGVQLYVDAGERTGGWLLVPIPDSTDVARLTAEGWNDALPITATWRPLAEGYELTADVTLPSDVTEIGVDVLVNENTPGRTRRRGQLVLSGARNEFVYLRADRHDRDRLLRVTLGAR
jgi:hypothetical protein